MSSEAPLVDTRKRNRQDHSDEHAEKKSSTEKVPTATQFVSQPQHFLTLPPELGKVDFTKRVSWRKFSPYSDESLPLVPIGTPPIFTSPHRALCFQVHGTSGRARATTLHFPSNRSVPTPIFMPVGTKGTIKAVTTEEICNEEALDCPIILGNTYHLALQPGTELIRDMGGLHTFMNWDRGILTDRYVFQSNPFPLGYRPNIYWTILTHFIRL